MMCQQCGEKPATLHFTKIVNGQKTEFHLCESCAREKGDILQGANDSFSIHNLLSGLMNLDQPTGLQNGLYGFSMNKPVPEKLKCDHCGLTFEQFSKMGRFGCDECYHAFSSRLDPILKRVHGNVVHVGKIPKRSGVVMNQRRELEDLRKQLQESIQLEQFETAAELRDRIRELELKMNGASDAEQA
ncbi:UvrB/UvrC motif-containing protein [Paenibacillus sp. 1001270B_150601_E10]|uniref:UvrB/UvrC motif-containing protein n=1 Tax=Paenibacillus sp. 1001270B_150601_E10 TaxID=2787079 RepID=UPI00189C692A|nr:UvrB/UvrC motif-containing protein [Paenibacillus sp. 1001270B_150601_E10]